MTVNSSNFSKKDIYQPWPIKLGFRWLKFKRKNDAESLPNPLLIYSAKVKVAIADWLLYPPLLYINIELGLRQVRGKNTCLTGRVMHPTLLNLLYLHKLYVRI